MQHGDIANCPTCGSIGTYDDMKHNIEGIGYAVFIDAIWLSKDHE